MAFESSLFFWLEVVFQTHSEKETGYGDVLG